MPVGPGRWSLHLMTLNLMWSSQAPSSSVGPLRQLEGLDKWTCGWGGVQAGSESCLFKGARPVAGQRSTARGSGLKRSPEPCQAPWMPRPDHTEHTLATVVLRAAWGQGGQAGTGSPLQRPAPRPLPLPWPTRSPQLASFTHNFRPLVRVRPGTVAGGAGLCPGGEAVQLHGELDGQQGVVLQLQGAEPGHWGRWGWPAGGAGHCCQVLAPLLPCQAQASLQLNQHPTPSSLLPPPSQENAASLCKISHGLGPGVC